MEEEENLFEYAEKHGRPITEEEIKEEEREEKKNRIDEWEEEIKKGGKKELRRLKREIIDIKRNEIQTIKMLKLGQKEMLRLIRLIDKRRGEL